ncbi:hypothetical protein ACP4OV_009240 [Aristida adscensionis]
MAPPPAKRRGPAQRARRRRPPRHPRPPAAPRPPRSPAAGRARVFATLPRLLLRPATFNRRGFDGLGDEDFCEDPWRWRAALAGVLAARAAPVAAFDIHAKFMGLYERYFLAVFRVLCGGGTSSSRARRASRRCSSSRTHRPLRVAVKKAPRVHAVSLCLSYSVPEWSWSIYDSVHSDEEYSFTEVEEMCDYEMMAKREHEKTDEVGNMVTFLGGLGGAKKLG